MSGSLETPKIYHNTACVPLEAVSFAHPGQSSLGSNIESAMHPIHFASLLADVNIGIVFSCSLFTIYQSNIWFLELELKGCSSSILPRLSVSAAYLLADWIVRSVTISCEHVMCKWEGVALVLIRVFYPRHWLM